MVNTSGVEFNLADILRAHAAARAGAPCLSAGGETISFGGMHSRSSQVANALRSQGIAPGDRVAVIARNSPAFYELAFACAKVGAILVALNWRLSSREVCEILDDARPSIVIAGGEQRELLPEPGAAQILSVIDLDHDYCGWRDAAVDTDPLYRGNADDTVALLYTSGTTGVPKGVMISHRNLSFSERMAREIWAFTPSSVNLVAMPLFHIGGLGYGMMALSQGGHTVLLQAPAPEPILEAIRAHRVTHAFFVPTVIQSLVNFPDVDTMDLSSLELMIYGASPINETLLLRAIAVFGCGFSHAYGLTETSGTVVTLAPADHDPGGPHACRLRSCGKPVPWAEVRLVDPHTGEPVSTSGVGEIQVRSGMVTGGYWNRPEASADAIDAEGWLHTGDAASQDADGYFYIQDRYKDMIVSGAENVYPTEVENVLHQHPAVAEAAVIGVTDERWGETVKAVVVIRAGQSLTAQELIAFTRARLAHYKCPTSVSFMDALPRSASGKILKRELRRLDWTQA